MVFSEVLDSMTHHDGGFTASASDDWRQGRSIFGGLQGALALRAMRGSAPQGLPLRVLQVAFIAPLDIGPFEIHTQVLRSGKSTMHVEARLVENGQTATQALGIFGRGRPSRVERVPEPTPVPHQEPMLAPFVAGLTPNFTQHFAMRWLYGGFPFSNTKVPLAVIEVSLTDSAKTREEHVVAIADAIPPVALSMLETIAPGSSLTWTLEMLRDHFDDLPLAGWRLHAELNAGREGYTSQSVLVCDPRGAPAALSHQSMVVFG
jgi:acyl-CoA thioesterase